MKNDHLLSEINTSYLHDQLKPGKMVDTITNNKFEPFTASKRARIPKETTKSHFFTQIVVLSYVCLILSIRSLFTCNLFKNSLLLFQEIYFPNCIMTLLIYACRCHKYPSFNGFSACFQTTASPEECFILAQFS